jgi:uncharacterized OB-fold protein
MQDERSPQARPELTTLRLFVQRCSDCQLWIAPARDLCPSCWSSEVHNQPVSGEATVFAATRLTVDSRTAWIGVAELVEQTQLRVLAEFDLPEDCDIRAVLDSTVHFSSVRREDSVEIPLFVRSQ